MGPFWKEWGPQDSGAPPHLPVVEFSGHTTAGMMAIGRRSVQLGLTFLRDASNTSGQPPSLGKTLPTSICGLFLQTASRFLSFPRGGSISVLVSRSRIQSPIEPRFRK